MQIHHILTQAHKDILDIIITHTKKINEYSYAAYISKYALLRQLGKNPGENYAWLTKKLDEITKTFYVAYYFAAKNIDKPIKTEPFTTMRYHFNPDTQKYKFELEPKFVFLFFYLQKYTCQYTALLDKILQVKYETVRAVVRYCLSFYTVHEDLFAILEKTGYGVVKSERTKRYIRKKFKDAAKQLAELNILYDLASNTISYSHKNTANAVKIYHRSLCALPNHSIKQTWEFIFS